LDHHLLFCIRTTHIYVHDGSLIANGGYAADSIGIFTQTFDMTGGEVYAAGSRSVLGPSYGLRSNKYLNISGGSITAISGTAQNDQSCGLMVNNTPSDSSADDGGTLTVTGGQIHAVGKTGAFFYGIKANNIHVIGGEINAEADNATGNGGGMTISSGITAENIFTASGGRISARGASAGTFSYGIEAFDMTLDGSIITAESGSAERSYGLWSFDEMEISGISSVVRAASENGFAVYSAGGIDIKSPLRINRPIKGIVAEITDDVSGTFYAISSDKGKAAKEALIAAFSPGGQGSSDPSDPADQIIPDTDCDGGADCPCRAYIDLDPYAWYHEAVDFVLKNGLMNGIGDGKFAPNGEMSRAMLVTILWRLEGEPIVNCIADFDDVDEDKWYTQAVCWAASENIAEGWNGNFYPMSAVTREQLAAILYRYEQSRGGGFTDEWIFPMEYADLDEISDWAYEAMCWMNMNEVINGRPGNILDPKNNAVRVEAAAMIQRYCEIMSEDA